MFHFWTSRKCLYKSPECFCSLADRESTRPHGRCLPCHSMNTACNGKPRRRHLRNTARTSAAGLNFPADHPKAARGKKEGLSSCTQSPRRRPKAMRAAKDPVWYPLAPRSGAKAHSRRVGRAQAPPRDETPGRDVSIFVAINIRRICQTSPLQESAHTHTKRKATKHEQPPR